jgi:hypothetical protein
VGSIEKISSVDLRPGASRHALHALVWPKPRKRARAWLMQEMHNSGLLCEWTRQATSSEDASRQDLPTLLSGSHSDSVPHGGNFDGDVGLLALSRRCGS